MSTENPGLKLLMGASELRRKLNEEISEELSSRMRVTLTRLIPGFIKEKFKDEYHIQGFFTEALREAIERAREKYGVSIAEISDVREVIKEWCEENVKKSLTIFNYRAYLSACNELANLRVPDFILIETITSMIRGYSDLPLIIPRRGIIWSSIRGDIRRLGIRHIDVEAGGVVLVTFKDELLKDIMDKIKEKEANERRVLEEIDRLRIEISKLRKRYEEVKDEKDKLEVEYSKLEEECKSIMDQLIEACWNKNYEDPEECVEKESNDKLISELSRKYEGLYSELEALKSKISHRDSVCKELEERIKTYEDQLKELNEGLDRIRSDINSLRQLYTDLRSYLTRISPEEYLSDVLSSLGNVFHESTRRALEQILQKEAIRVIVKSPVETEKRRKAMKALRERAKELKEKRMVREPVEGVRE